MTDHITSAPLVGSHFYPPAKQLLAALRAGTLLRLEREPQNAFDANAIGVWIELADIAYALDLDMEAMAGYGFYQADFEARRSWQLGHVAAKTGEAAALAPLLDGGEEPVATLGFDMKGAPQVRLEWADV
jgi:hypothetical protein